MPVSADREQVRSLNAAEPLSLDSLFEVHGLGASFGRRTQHLSIRSIEPLVRGPSYRAGPPFLVHGGVQRRPLEVCTKEASRVVMGTFGLVASGQSAYSPFAAWLRITRKQRPGVFEYYWQTYQDLFMDKTQTRPIHIV